MTSALLTQENFATMALHHRDRQAGVSMIYDPHQDIFVYNAYCIELKLLKELFSRECATLDEALAVINEEFAGWQLRELAQSGGACCQAGPDGGCCGRHHQKE